MIIFGPAAKENEMENDKHKECYGTMFPDALHFRENKPSKGKVFFV
jgi:hypothetical protein